MDASYVCIRSDEQQQTTREETKNKAGTQNLSPRHRIPLTLCCGGRRGRLVAAVAQPSEHVAGAASATGCSRARPGLTLCSRVAHVTHALAVNAHAITVAIIEAAEPRAQLLIVRALEAAGDKGAYTPEADFLSSWTTQCCCSNVD